MTIQGIGTDLVFVPRIQQLHQRFGQRFVQRILTQQEIAKMQTLQDPIPFLAKRFAAKEALSKALGTGIGQSISFQDMSILNDPQGKPTVEWSEKGKYLLQQKGIGQVHISLSDEKDYALAFVLLSA